MPTKNVVEIANLNKKINLLSPIGGFGNHVRWLMLLDPEFQFSVIGTQESYNNLRGPDWPSYDNYKSDRWENTSLEIKEEIIGFFSRNVCVNIESKLKFIQDNIYHSGRSWSNWLSTEWGFREDLDNFIDLKHKLSDLQMTSLPTVILKINPDLAYRAYLKFNSNLNNSSPEKFKQNTVLETVKKNLLITETNNNTLVLAADILYQPTLDYDFYKKLITWGQLADQYTEANFVHGLWYQAHNRSELEIVRDLSAIYK